MNRILVRDLMIPNPITIAHDQTVEQAMALMRRYKVRRLPVTKGGELAGIVSDRDVRQLAGRPSSLSGAKRDAVSSSGGGCEVV
ncbi:MAG: CBS domain-containing protein [Nitrospiria bacterium]